MTTRTYRMSMLFFLILSATLSFALVLLLNMNAGIDVFRLI